MWPKLFALYFPSFNGCKGWKLQKGTQSLGQPNYLAVTIEYRNCRLIRTWSKVKVALWNPNGLYSPWNSPGQNAGLGSLSLLQGNLPNSGIEPMFPALQADCLPTELPKSSLNKFLYWVIDNKTICQFLMKEHLVQGLEIWLEAK